MTDLGLSPASLAELQASQMLLELDPAPKAKRTSALRAFHSNASTGVQEALRGEEKAQTQNESVLAWMRAHRGRHTPAAVWEGLGQPCPLTSIRRGLSDMTKRGLLRHWPGDRRPGLYGAANSTWEAL